MKNILTIKDLCVDINNAQILKNISLDLKENEILGIIGESGSGKSTLINAITNMMDESYKITKGEIIFNDININKLNSKEMRKILGKDIGFVFQNAKSSLNPTEKIYNQFLDVIRSHEEVNKNECRDRIIKTLENLNLSHADCIIDSYPFELSGGMNQRVAIGLATIMKPKLLIADEPTSALDIVATSKVLDELLYLKNNLNMSVIIVTHSMKVVSKIADKVAVMNSGEIVEYGTKEDILNNPQNPYTNQLIKSAPKLSLKSSCI